MSGDDEPDPAAAREQVVEAMARSAEVYGLSRSYGRLYGVLYFADEPLSLDDLAEESGYAKSTVSTAMKTLERFHLVHRRSIPGEGKRAFFEAERDFWHVGRELLKQEMMREVTIMTRALDEAEAMLEDAEGERAQQDLERVRQLQRIYGTVEQLVDLVANTPIDRLIELLQPLGGEE